MEYDKQTFPFPYKHTFPFSTLPHNLKTGLVCLYYLYYLHNTHTTNTES